MDLTPTVANPTIWVFGVHRTNQAGRATMSDTDGGLAQALADVQQKEGALAEAIAERDRIITERLEAGDRAMNLAIETGLTPARIYQIAKREETAC